MLDQLTDVDSLWNTSKFDLPKLLDDPDNIADNLRAYIAGFSPEAREILDQFDFATQITRLHKAELLYLVLGKFAEIDLHPDPVSQPGDGLPLRGADPPLLGALATRPPVSTSRRVR